ncbi:MAG: hypothetical protein ACYDAY_10740 [Candidatus Dormibacteria bacterium]
MPTVDEVIAAIESARDKVMADETKALVKLGIPRTMAYQMIATRFHQKPVGPEEGEFDSSGGAGSAGWDDSLAR